MADVMIHGPVQDAADESTLHLTVRGCEVLAIFVPEKNVGVYQQVRRTLIDACTGVISNESGRNLDKIREM